MCQYTFILGKQNKTKQKSAILMKDIDNGEGYAWVGTEVYGKSPYLSLNLL